MTLNNRYELRHHRLKNPSGVILHHSKGEYINKPLMEDGDTLSW
jgi:hypothetical protein